MNQPIPIQSIHNSNVLVRVNYDLPNLNSLERITDTIPTIKLLLENNNRVVLLTHIGRPTHIDPVFSTQKIAIPVEKTLQEPMMFLNQFASFEAIKEIFDNSPNRLFLMENTRFNSIENTGSSKEKLDLAKEYAKFGSYFVDEAFAVSHRTEATNSSIKELLPYTYGLSYDREVKELNKLKELLKNPKSGVKTVIMGGAKLKTKLNLIQKILPQVDHLILGGKLAFTFLEAQNNLKLKPKVDIYDSQVETEFLDTAKSLLMKFHSKIILPSDLIIGTADNGISKLGYDIGSDSIKEFGQIVSNSSVIFWNGPMGFCEKKEYAVGTLATVESIVSNAKAYKVIGGGDTLGLIDPKAKSKFNFVSMGGGATLSYLGGE